MDKRISLIIIVFLIMGISYQTFAFDVGYFSEHAKGWHWYDDPKKDQEEPINEELKKDPLFEMNAIREKVDRALNQAVLNPSKETVSYYINLQNQVNNQSEKFEKYWKSALLEHPELDYSLKHPTNNLAKQVEYKEDSLREEALIRELAKKSGLFFFYRSSCPYCVRFAPIVKDFAETYGITVIPITTDGISLPEFPNSYPDHGQAQKFHVTVEPALFAVNPYTQKAFPIAYGLTSATDLKRRIVEIATNFGGFVK